MPTQQIVEHIMQPDQVNSELYREGLAIPHRAEGNGMATFLANFKSARRLAGTTRVSGSTVGHIIWLIHMATDFCTMAHAPGVLKDSIRESQYETEIDRYAETYHVRPNNAAIRWYQYLPRDFSFKEWVNRAYGEHWEKDRDTITSRPDLDFNRAVFFASATLLAALGHSEAVTDAVEPRPNYLPWWIAVGALFVIAPWTILLSWMLPLGYWIHYKAKYAF